MGFVRISGGSIEKKIISDWESKTLSKSVPGYRITEETIAKYRTGPGMIISITINGRRIGGEAIS